MLENHPHSHAHPPLHASHSYTFTCMLMLTCSHIIVLAQTKYVHTTVRHLFAQGTQVPMHLHSSMACPNPCTSLSCICANKHMHHIGTPRYMCILHDASIKATEMMGAFMGQGCPCMVPVLHHAKVIALLPSGGRAPGADTGCLAP